MLNFYFILNDFFSFYNLSVEFKFRNRPSFVEVNTVPYNIHRKHRVLQPHNHDEHVDLTLLRYQNQLQMESIGMHKQDTLRVHSLCLHCLHHRLNWKLINVFLILHKIIDSIASYLIVYCNCCIGETHNGFYIEVLVQMLVFRHRNVHDHY